MSTFVTECRRCLARRAVRVLVAVAVVGCIVTGVVGVVVGDDLDLASGDPVLVRLADLWRPDDPMLGMPLALLVLGALLGGAMVVGGEWRAGTVPTVLTWQPNRQRLLGARLAACAVLAAVIALALLAAFVAVGVVPGVLAHGEAGGVGGDWAWELAGAVARGVAVAALAATLGGAIASLGRSTTAAVAGLFVYQAVLEPVARALWPARRGWLLSENAIAWVGGEPVVGEGFALSPLAGGATLVAYLGVAVALALAAFHRQDVAAVS